jgi:BASS family bile acid:Na+ symporter
MTQFDPFLIALGTLSVLVFVITSMVGMGFSLTVQQIAAPLRNTRLVLMSLAANFIIVPLLVMLIVQVIPLPEGIQIGLILAGMAAGAPFLPKLVQVAKGDMAFAAGLMVMLMVITIAFLPVVLPLVLIGVQVNPQDIAKKPRAADADPLAASLLIRAVRRSSKGASSHHDHGIKPFLVVMFIAYFVAYYDDTLQRYQDRRDPGSHHPRRAVVVGYLVGGATWSAKTVCAEAVAQLATAFAVALQLSSNPDVLIEVMEISVIGLLVPDGRAGHFGRHSVARLGITRDREGHDRPHLGKSQNKIRILANSSGCSALIGGETWLGLDTMSGEI